MQLADFDFNLPKELIAQTPARPRDHARLLVYRRNSRQITDDYFYNLDKYLLPKTTLVLNDSKVEKSRLRFDATEIFVIETLDAQTIRALVRPGKKFPAGSQWTTTLNGGNLSVDILAVDNDGVRTLKLSMPLDDDHLDPFRQTPFPPYIQQDESLASQYQTVYARPLGSKAAPTAGLHFTDQQLKRLSISHPLAKLTLHVGLGTFAPIKVTKIEDHKMHAEDYFINTETAEILNQAASITAVGTTTLRVLESLQKPFKETSDTTDIFIRPGYKFKSVDSLITNFHLPKSSLLVLVAAFIGSVTEIQNIYAHAINVKYRFYSFGDAMLII